MSTRPAPMFDPKGQTVVWRAIVELIEARINDGTYPPDSRIPGNVALAEETGAARETVRKALDDLIASGHLWPVPGKGTFVVGPQVRKLAESAARQTA